jgi:short subunit dehydrogenase-like uncharacterized protein
MERDYQIIVWGATGFTGQIVTEYLDNNYGSEIRWAIAGRNLEKLQNVKQKLQLDAKIECMVGDSFDEASLRAISSRTDVIISTVGPYALYGKALVSACVQTKTDYCDLTGEIPFVKDSIDSFHEQARANEVKIVHSCGYDSIPSDIGCLLLQEKAKEKYGQPASNVKLFVLGTKGKFSGGTVASMINLMKEAKDPEKRQIQSDPYILCKDVVAGMPNQRIQNFVWYDPRIEKWTAPFVMARFNSRIVFRTNDLKQYDYGRNFMYDEGLAVGYGMRGRFRGSMFMLAISIFIKLMSMSFTRSLLQKTVLPKPGEGPSKTEREGGYFKVKIIGQDVEGENRTEVFIADSNDPGYGSTAKMLAETALCLALNADMLPKQYGVITPAVAMGTIIAGRLKKAGFIITVDG